MFTVFTYLEGADCNNIFVNSGKCLYNVFVVNICNKNTVIGGDESQAMEGVNNIIKSREKVEMILFDVKHNGCFGRKL